MELLQINPWCLNINLLNGKSCLFWTNVVQQYLFNINSQQTISYLLLIKITDFLFQATYKPEKLAPTQCAIDSAGAFHLDLPPHSKVYKNSYSPEWQISHREVRCGGKPGGNGWDLSSQGSGVQNGSALFSPQPEVPRAHRLELSLGTLNVRTSHNLSASIPALSGLAENNTPAVCQGDICRCHLGLTLSTHTSLVRSMQKCFQLTGLGRNRSILSLLEHSSARKAPKLGNSYEKWKYWSGPELRMIPPNAFSTLLQSIHVPEVWDCLNCWVPRKAAPAGLHCDDTKLPEGAEKDCAIPVSLIHINWQKMHLQQENAY